MKLSVSQVNDYIKELIDETLVLSGIQVVGEVSESKISGAHTYFTITDGLSVLSCVRWGKAERLQIGAKYIVYGSVKFWAKTSKLNLSVVSVRPYGEGELLVNLIKLKEQLKKEGVFDNARELPAYVRRIAIVTSPTGAVVHDFCDVVRRLNKNIDVVLVPCRVQGEGAELEIASALNLTDKINDIDVIVLARGGGSAQDLAAFNTETAARALHACKAVTVSAIGHETDYTLCDFAADMRAGTPSIAAEMIAAPLRLLRQRVIELALRARQRIEQLYDGTQSYTRHLTGAMITNSQISLDRCHNIVVRYAAACYNKTDSLLTSNTVKTETAIRLLNKSNPLKLLESGYARVTKSGVTVDKAGDLRMGDSIEIIMSGGTVGAKISKESKSNRKSVVRHNT